MGPGPDVPNQEQDFPHASMFTPLISLLQAGVLQKGQFAINNELRQTVVMLKLTIPIALVFQKMLINARADPTFFCPPPNPAPTHQEHPWEIPVLGALGFGARGAGGDGDEPGKGDAGRAVVCPGELCTAAQPPLERCYRHSG